MKQIHMGKDVLSFNNLVISLSAGRISYVVFATVLFMLLARERETFKFQS